MLAALRGSPSVWVARAAVSLLVAAAFLLAVWGNDHGLPYVFNADENSHFLPKAIGLFGHDWNPGYFVNPPGFTYLLYGVLSVLYGDGDAVARSFAADPTEVYVAARTTTAVLLAMSVWLIYLAGARMFNDRRVGVLAAGVLAFAFLPLFYAHHALNDVPTMVPVCLALYGIAGVVRYGRLRDLALAGAAIGIACAVKYTAGIMVLSLLAAALVAAPPSGLTRRQMVVFGLPVAGVLSIVLFIAVNPYSLLDSEAFRDGLTHQSTAAGDERGKLGLSADNGISYYLWSMTWGLGWVPLLAASAGAGIMLADRPRLAAVLVPAPVVFILFMGAQERFFGRWMLPIYPILALLAAYAFVSVLALVWRRWPRLEPALLMLAATALWTQGIISAVHLGRVMSRDDTRNVARAWMVKNVPEASKVVVEPIAPDAWAQDIASPSPLTSNGNRWVKFPTSRSNIANDGSWIPGRGRLVNIEDYERTLYPGLIARYQREGFCWVVVGSTQVGRAEAEPKKVPRAIAYYKKLQESAELRYRVSPFHAGEKPVPFNFDWSFDYYPQAYERPGPEIWIYRLRGGLCGPERPAPLQPEPAS